MPTGIRRTGSLRSHRDREKTGLRLMPTLNFCR